MQEIYRETIKNTLNTKALSKELIMISIGTLDM